MLISSILKDEKNPSMSRVFLENNISFCLPRKRIEALSLSEGMEIEPERLEYILSTEVYASARSSAVNFLTSRLRTAQEVEQKLYGLGYEREIVERVIESLKEINYIDDYQYAIKFFAEKIKLKPKSVKMLSMELSSRGVPGEIIDAAQAEFDIDEECVALDLLKRKYSKYTSFDEKTIHKMRTFLAARGFSSRQASEAISSFLPEDEQQQF